MATDTSILEFFTRIADANPNAVIVNGKFPRQTRHAVDSPG
jgi:hypothetical protein